MAQQLGPLLLLGSDLSDPSTHMIQHLLDAEGTALKNTTLHLDTHIYIIKTF